MGIHERDYYRREGPSILGAMNERAPVCKWLIIVNVVVFIFQIATNSRDGTGFNLTTLLELDPMAIVEHGEVWRLLSYAFLHDLASPWHIICNMLFLWWMGCETEELYGSKEFLVFYLVSAVFAGGCFLLHSLALPYHPSAIGASGAVVAVAVLFACHYPNRTILFLFIIPMPLWLPVAIFVGHDFLTFLLAGGEAKTAVAAHLGGALFGFCYFKLDRRFTGLWTILSGWKKKRARPQLRLYREEPTPATVPARVPAEHEIDEHLEAKLDAVLEKMSLVGKDNLTDSEKEILMRASEIYRRRRN